LKGVDYAWLPHPSIAALKASGIGFVARYLSPDYTKNLTSAEARALLGAGISIVLVWESYAKRMREGTAAGKDDARTAIAEAKVLGLWKRGPKPVIYFACDYDAPPEDQAGINAYLDGAAFALGGGWRRLGRKRLGVYGGYWPLSRARAAGKASYWWATPAWSGGEWDTHTWYHIMQSTQPSGMGGVNVDLDASMAADFGQWPRPVTVPPYVYVADGLTSMATLSADTKLPISTMLRWTTLLSKPHMFTPVMSAYIQGADLNQPVPAGQKIALRKP
jgi:hypothetical protein